MGLFDELFGWLFTPKPEPKPPPPRPVVWPEQEPYIWIRSQLRQAYADGIKRLSLTCHCGGLAQPVLDSGNRYRCPRCNRQFAAAGHKLSAYGLYERTLPGEYQQFIRQQFLDEFDRLAYVEMYAFLEKALL